MQAGQAHPEDDEVLSAAVLQRHQVEDLLRQGAIRDAKTLVGLAHIAWWPCRP